MNTTLWVLQLIVTFVAIAAYWVPLFHGFKEFGLWGLVLLLLPPVLLFYYIPTRWQRCKYAVLVLVACVALAAVLQRGRLGYWAWPDVEL